ncbi:Cytochrome oxidase biogenesis protein Sco1 /SenC /PrrC, putative copper metallochaperone [Altererythrobacter epoxidivorans]|uniref:Cytochrome oxidase biogenesis protein Sco1 /SenC /PrrC, putative copper metallochaperone n=1 Tax=Altererythrobacter epoxidivorans TaxID=361183 RepID=A0A0M4MI87_9SPHN|nr:SCO family protein [Altererythrobacter epoxidivorans]ALE17418.1 Cytochrome oxidase biogenesis protein Sco1 /SenC /PrrC, putative copper metallochaperone [Altererythrobacter epoxidivorans]
MNRHAMPIPFRFCFLMPLAAASLALSACGQTADTPAMEPPLAGADIGGEFELVNQDGKLTRWSDFDGQYRMIYFGFTFCPDICPTDVSRAIKGLEKFAEDEPQLAAKVQPIFVSVDPERDTPEAVGQFASAFSDRMIGLTGTPEQVKAAADTFRVFYSRGEDTPGGGYLVNHSAIVYLFGPKGEPLATLPTDQGPDAVAEELAKWVN